MLRELMQFGQYIHSHSLHFYFLAAPDFVFTPDGDRKPEERLRRQSVPTRRWPPRP